MDHEGHVRYCIFCIIDGEPLYFTPEVKNDDKKGKSDLLGSTARRRRLLSDTKAREERNIDIDRAENDGPRRNGVGGGVVVQLHSLESKGLPGQGKESGTAAETNMGAVCLQPESVGCNERDSSIHGLTQRPENTASDRPLRDQGDMERSLSANGMAQKEMLDNDGLVLDLFGNPIEKKPVGGALAERFLVPPFTVLDARQGYWTKRKAEWIAMGITSEDGRNSHMDVVPGGALQNSDLRRRGVLHSSATGKKDGEEFDGGDCWLASGSSIFDPVLCELSYLWFAPPGGKVLDPFAGGSVRGIVAEELGYRYTGIELRAEQITANQKQAAALGLRPNWILGDSYKIDDIVPVPPYDEMFDMIFACPPYYDLEQYSESNEDGSAKQTYTEFLVWYEAIFKKCVARLKWNRFSVIVVGEIRDENGWYRNFVGDTVSVIQRCGLRYYNEAILVTSVGSLPLRVNGQFGGYRKLGKTHQNVLVFYNGNNCDQIAEKFGKLL